MTSSTNSCSLTLNSRVDFIFLIFDLLSWHQARHFEVSFLDRASSTSLATRKRLMFVRSLIPAASASLMAEL